MRNPPSSVQHKILSLKSPFLHPRNTYLPFIIPKRKFNLFPTRLPFISFNTQFQMESSDMAKGEFRHKSSIAPSKCNTNWNKNKIAALPLGRAAILTHRLDGILPPSSLRNRYLCTSTLQIVQFPSASARRRRYNPSGSCDTSSRSSLALGAPILTRTPLALVSS